MKKLVFIFAITLLSGSIFAQTTNAPEEAKSAQEVKAISTHHMPNTPQASGLDVVAIPHPEATAAPATATAETSSENVSTTTAPKSDSFQKSSKNKRYKRHGCCAPRSSAGRGCCAPGKSKQASSDAL